MKRVLLAVVCGLTLLAPSMSQAYSWPGNKWLQGNPTTVNVTVGSTIPSSWAYYMGRAMGAWNGAGAKFQFMPSTDGKHQINLRWMPWYPTSLALTHIYEGQGNKTTTDRDIDFNSIFSWDVNGASNKYDAWSTATHELGHWLTLLDLYNASDYAKTMYGSGAPGQTYQRTLEPDDINGVRAIYGVR